MPAPLSPEVLELLRCPISGQPMQLAPAEELSHFPGEFPEGGLVTAGGAIAYPIEKGIPVLVASQARRRGEDEAQEEN